MSTHPIMRLWRGEIPLARVFWEYMVAWGTLLNLICTGAALAAFLRGAPAYVGLALHFAALPLNLLLLISVWRAAAREKGSQIANLVRVSAVAWFVAMLVL